MPSRIRIRTTKTSQQPNMADWLKRETPHQRKALETASRHFDKHDAMDVHTLEALSGQESSFGKYRGKRNSDGAVGDFQMKKSVAQKIGLHVSEKNDERFDLDSSSAAAAKQLKSSDNYFSKETTLWGNTKSIPVVDPEERKKFVTAAYNAGDSRIAKAQRKALEAGEDPTKWNNVKKYLEKAGATKQQADETRE
jgi:membrane-bound lytic murein transglycosylase MltF